MPPRSTHSTVLALAIALALALPAPAMAGEYRKRDNIVAVALEAPQHAAGARTTAVELEVLKKQDGDIDHVNYAESYTSCDGCRTVAVAIQVVLVRQAQDVVPRNAAVALNEDCTGCSALALAYQFVVDGDKLTSDGKEAVRDIEDEVEATVADTDLTDAEIAAQVEVLMDELDRVLETEVRGPKGGAERSRSHGATDEDDD